VDEDLKDLLKTEINHFTQNLFFYKRLKANLLLAPSKRSKEESYELNFTLRDIPFFKARQTTLDSSTVKVVCNHFKYKRIPELHYVIPYQQFGNGYFYILKGVVRILRPNPHIDNWEKKRAEYEKLGKWKEQVYDPKLVEAKKNNFEAQRRRSLMKRRIGQERTLTLNIEVKSPTRLQTRQLGSPTRFNAPKDPTPKNMPVTPGARRIVDGFSLQVVPYREVTP